MALNRCISCGAPAPQNRSEFHFNCEFCGTKNVDQDYLLQKAKSGEIKTQNKYFESAILAIDSQDYAKALKLIDEALHQDSNNQEALIYQAFCSAALIKPSNFEKSLKIAEVALNRAKNLGENETYDLGKNQVTNMFLEQSPYAANYYFETANKKLLAFGSDTNGKTYYLSELTRGINIFQKVIELNPTNLEKKVLILILALEKIHECEEESTAFSNLVSNSGSLSREEVINLKNNFYKLLYEINLQNSELVGQSITKSRYANKIRMTLKSMLPKENVINNTSKNDSNSIKSQSSTNKNWFLIGGGAFAAIVLFGVMVSKDKSTASQTQAQQSQAQESKTKISNLTGKNAFEFFSDQKAMELFSQAVGEKNVNDAKNYFMVSSPSTREGNWIIAEGCLPKNCDTDNGIIVVDNDSTKMIVGIYDKDENRTLLFNSMGLQIKQVDGFYTLGIQTPQKLKDWLRERGSNFRD